MDLLDPILWLIAAYVAAFASVPAVLLRRQGQPYAALVWLVLLFAAPGFGAIAWWLVGRTRLAGGSAEGAPEGSALFPTRGSGVSLLVDGRQAYPAMEAAIRDAQHRIDAVFYIWKDDTTGRRIRDLLAAKAAQGVAVRVLVDAFGSPGFRGRFTESIEQSGGQVAQFFPDRLLRWHPLVNFINHRKILVVDDVAFTGGMNIGNEYANEWRDLMLRVTGPAAEALAHVFEQDWGLADGERDDLRALRGRAMDDSDLTVVASGPDSRHSWMHFAFFRTFVDARQRIWITTPYFIPSEALIVALEFASLRGVDVRLVVPRNSDVFVVRLASQTFYPRLLKAGIRVFEYQGAMLHAKAILVDDKVATVGTANLDSRSFRLSFEVACFAWNEALNRNLSVWHTELQENSREVTEDVMRQRGVFSRLLNSTVHLLSPLL